MRTFIHLWVLGLVLLALTCPERLGASGLGEESSGGLGLSLISPLPGEWVNVRALHVVADVWMQPAAGYDDEIALRMYVNQSFLGSYNLTKWNSRLDGVNPAHLHASWPIVPGHELHNSGSLPLTTTWEGTFEISDIFFDRPRNEAQHLQVTAFLTKRNCQAPCEPLLVVTVGIQVFASWGHALAVVRSRPEEGRELVSVGESAGDAWPPAGVILQWPREGSCVHKDGCEGTFALIGGLRIGDGVRVLLDGEQVGRTLSAWDRHFQLNSLSPGTHCLRLQHVRASGSAVLGTPEAGACFVVGGLPPHIAGETVCEVGAEVGEKELRKTGRGRVMLFSWLPPVHHITGMSERLWQVTERLLERNITVLLASVMCSSIDTKSQTFSSQMDPRIQLLSCGSILTQSEIAKLLLAHPVEFIMVASWWFNHPMNRALPELVLPLARKHAPQSAVVFIVDDLFVPDESIILGPVIGDASRLMGVCGAQTFAFAGGDGIGTLTGEDAVQMTTLLPHIPVTRIRYAASWVDGPQHQASMRRVKGLRPPTREEYVFRGGRLLYIGSCQDANIAALRWLLEHVLPILRLGVQEDFYPWVLAVAGWISPSLCPSERGEGGAICEGGLCEGLEAGGVRGTVSVEFLGYVPDMDAEIGRSSVLLAPRLAGLGQSTKVILGLESGLPTVTTPHGTVGYNISKYDGTQGVLVGASPVEFAQQILMLMSDVDLWQMTAEAGLQHAWGEFAPRLQGQDVEELLKAARDHRSKHRL